MFKAYAACGAFDFTTCTKVVDQTSGYLNAALASILFISWAIAAIFLAVGAIQYITSAGDKNKAGDAKQTLTNTLIGIVVILSISGILSVIGNIFTGGTTSGGSIKLPSAPTVTGGGAKPAPTPTAPTPRP